MSLINTAIVFTLAAIWFGEPNSLEARPLVSGFVMDQTGARVRDASVTLQGEGQHLTVKTADDGGYSLQPKPGRFTITVTHPGFCPWRRPEFVVGIRDSIQFDFEITVCQRKHGML